MIDVRLINMQIFEVKCVKCRKVKEVHIPEGMVGTKDFNSIQCVCGHEIPIELLTYLFRNKQYIEHRIKYFFG